MQYHNSRQLLEYVLSKELGKVSAQNAELQAPVLTQWAQKVVGQQEGGSGVGATTNEFLFNQNVYSAEETTHLRQVCEKTYGKHSKGAFREGTEDGWRIVQGIVEGMIICRRLPQFFNRIMLTEDKLMIIGIVRAQVERLLIMDLDGELPVKEEFQSTKSLQESISIATMNRNTDHQQLWGLLAAVKTISYNAAKHEIHFYFFTREAASRFDGLEAPFHRATHRLVNAQPAGRRAPGANVWELQYEEDGALISTASEYVVILRNVTRILDLGRLHAFLKHVLRVPFVFEDLAQSSLNRVRQQHGN
ncbi:hypothetical protein PF005_g28586 [Phytophthora fragariae]|uniref:Uncharacterized protein n=2 Tax=Phytophthora fragariae TaxID=53985 RepID=A0A6A3VLI6_9STRA|nr:hypothetical protein PF010_g28162 [Phytophthora fragariae]KAE9066397.1 hypothetical protein PF007_g28491 [Phytophthora fragariae]KAE9076228.1 hypothetical protein PF006_g28173 [Phytophthora fragariae]KAE9167940.1 hypothetical protein PF005_g28586 [Phytophthora fragariae]KAE9171929.1 hypothetical protein PF004_g27417 [Phytophthora fragariae]